MLVGRTILLCLSVCVGLVACRPDDGPLEQRFQEALDARVRHCEVKGASVAIILPDSTIWQGASGISHETVQMSPEMTFAVGRITKNMVAALVLQLAEEGKLSLEDPIGEWLPAHPHVNESITIRQLIGTTAYMIHLPDHGVSIALMVSQFGDDCASLIAKDIAGVAARSGS